MDVVCYYRHSTENFAQDRNSIERQKASCRSHAEYKGWNIILEISDKGVSGTTDKENLISLQKQVAEGFRFDALLVDEQSRLSRKTVFEIYEDIGFLEKHDIKLAIVTNKNGEAIDVSEMSRDIGFLIKGWANNEEVRDTAERVVGGMLSLHKAGKLGWIGKTPLGFDKLRPWDETKPPQEQPPSHLVANDDLRFVTQIFEHVLQGNSFRSCVAILEQTSRFRDETEKNPSSQSVKHILRNPIYCGLWALGVRNVGKYEVMRPKAKRNVFGVNVLDNCAQIVDYDVKLAVSKEQFLAVQRIMDDNRTKSRGRPVSAGHRYSGLLKCSDCGGAIVAHRRRWLKKGASQEHLVDYVCVASTQGGRKCKSDKPFRKSFREEELDTMLSNFFGEEVSLNFSFHYRLIKMIVDDIKGASSETKPCDDQLANIEIEEKKLKMVLDKLDDVPDWVLEWMSELQSQRREVEGQKQSRKVSLSEICEQQYQEMVSGGSEIRVRYLGSIWKVAKKIASGQISEDDPKGIRDAIDEIILETFLKEGTDQQYLINQEDEVVGFTFPDPDEVLKPLRDIGLEEIRCNWTVGMRRGRPKRLLNGVEITFFWGNLVTDMSHRLTCAFQIGDETASLELKTF